MVTLLPFLLGKPSGASPILSFAANSFSRCSYSLINSASLRASSKYLALSAFACNSPNGSKRSLSGLRNGFLIQLPRSVKVVLLGLPRNTSYALLSGGSANGLAVGGRPGMRESLRLVDVVSGREYEPAPNSVLLRSVKRVW